ncbi:hypothetical protein VNI00_016804 [Paramarasmius palmivorus]|uniref:MYND-type domain-containing protein n=1 Tax=Paramarasmius palmivorus TaxID=297713 RepID=A0AAW0BAX9_9AGAR
MVFLSLMPPPHRTIRLKNVHGLCGFCETAVGDEVVRCSDCLSATYCVSYPECIDLTIVLTIQQHGLCQKANLPAHQSLCRAIQACAISESTPLAIRLQEAGRCYISDHYNLIKFVVAERLLTYLDRTVTETEDKTLRREPESSFVHRFRAANKTFLWVLPLCEKDGALREGPPRAQDLFFPHKDHPVIRLDQDFCNLEERSMMKEAQKHKAALDEYNAGLIVLVRIMDSETVVVAEIFICVDVPDIRKLQFALLPDDPVQALFSATM